MVLTRSNDRLMLNCPLKSVGATTSMKNVDSFRSRSAHTFAQTICENSITYRCFHFKLVEAPRFKQNLDALNRSSPEKRNIQHNATHETQPKRYLFC